MPEAGLRLGISVYLGEPEEENIARLRCSPARGVTRAFTSLQVLEESDVDDQAGRVKRLAAAAKAAGVQVYADVGPPALDRLIPRSDPVQQFATLAEWGVGVRLDDGFDMATAAAASHVIDLQLNASTITHTGLGRLLAAGVVPERVEVLHNYYPRVDTGLAVAAYRRANRRLHEEGFVVAAFAPGDGVLRGPLFEGLPTLERHRGLDPLVAALDLRQSAEPGAGADVVYVGDIDLAENTWQRWALLAEGVVAVRWQVTARRRHARRVADLVTARRMSNRPDECERVVRVHEARRLVAEAFDGEPLVLADEASGAPRPRGSVTVDNERYGRYLGEVQLVREDLPADPRVTVLGHVVASDVPLLDLLPGGAAFVLQSAYLAGAANTST